MDKKNIPIISDILIQLAEEVAFLWILRDRGVCAPHYLLSDFAKLADRIEAHLDGLRIAGEASRKIYQEALSIEEAGDVFAACNDEPWPASFRSTGPWISAKTASRIKVKRFKFDHVHFP